MAQVTLYECDVCKSTDRSRESWLKLSSYADKDAKCIDICSNRCLVKLAKERFQSSKELTTRQKYNDDFKLEVVTFANSTSVDEASEKYSVRKDLIYKWRQLIDPNN